MLSPNTNLNPPLMYTFGNVMFVSHVQSCPIHCQRAPPKRWQQPMSEEALHSQLACKSRILPAMYTVKLTDDQQEIVVSPLLVPPFKKQPTTHTLETPIELLIGFFPASNDSHLQQLGPISNICFKQWKLDVRRMSELQDYRLKLANATHKISDW